jgi:hypothetical protein
MIREHQHSMDEICGRERNMAELLAHLGEIL